MGRTQWIAAAVATALLVFTYVACPVRPAEVTERDLDQRPTATTGLESLIRAARGELSPTEIATLARLETELDALDETADPQPILEQLAGEWYRAGHPSISGIYARRIAEQVNTEDAWSITGTTFNICLKKEGQDDRTRQFCAAQAEQAYQAAISLNPDNPDNRINLAVSYTDFPPQDNPMKGILLLRELVEDYPDNPRVYLTLAQLAMRTNQFERAAERLETALDLAPDSPDVVCNLARVYETLKRASEAQPLVERCRELVEAQGG